MHRAIIKASRLKQTVINKAKDIELLTRYPSLLLYCAYVNAGETSYAERTNGFDCPRASLACQGKSTGLSLRHTVYDTQTKGGGRIRPPRKAVAFLTLAPFFLSPTAQVPYGHSLRLLAKQVFRPLRRATKGAALLKPASFEKLE